MSGVGHGTKRLDGFEARDTFEKCVAGAIAFTALLGAFAGFFESRVSKQIDEVAIVAHRLGVRALQQLMNGIETAQAHFESSAMLQEDLITAGNEYQSALRARARGVEAERSAHDSEMKLRLALAKEPAPLSQINPGTLYNPNEGSPPSQMVPTFVFQSRYPYTFALQDAVNERHGTLKRQQTHYSAILVLFVVAELLFGLSLARRPDDARATAQRATDSSQGGHASPSQSRSAGTRPAGQPRDKSLLRSRVLASLAAALMLVGGLWMATEVWGASRPPESPSTPQPPGCPETAEGTTPSVQSADTNPQDEKDIVGISARRAAWYYARGRYETDRGDFGQAAKLLTCAIKVRERFLFARLDRAWALQHVFRSRWLAGFEGPAQLQQAVQDMEAAQRGGVGNPRLVQDLGFFKLLQALEEPHPSRQSALLTESERYSQEAIREQSTDPAPYFNLALALLADRSEDAAREAYGNALLHAIFPDGDRGKTRNHPPDVEDAVAGSLSDLEMLLAAPVALNAWKEHSDALQSMVLEMKQCIVRAASGAPFCGGLGDRAAAAVSSVELDLHPREIRWRATLRQFDPAHDTLSVQWYYQEHDPFYADVWTVLPGISGIRQIPSKHGMYEQAEPFFGGCLQPGRYRVEVYVNGRLVGQQQRTAAWGMMKVAYLPDLNVEMCVPDSWQRWSEAFPGYRGGYVDPGWWEHEHPGQGRGIYVFRIHQPRVSTEHQRVQLGWAKLREIMKANFTSASLGVAPQDTFMWLRGGRIAEFNSAETSIRAAAGVDPDGAVIVAIAFAPKSDPVRDDLLGIISGTRTMYPLR